LVAPPPQAPTPELLLEALKGLSALALQDTRLVREGETGDVARAGLVVENTLRDGAADLRLRLTQRFLRRLAVAGGDGEARALDVGPDRAAYVPIAGGTLNGLSNPLLGGCVAGHSVSPKCET